MTVIEPLSWVPFFFDHLVLDIDVVLKLTKVQGHKVKGQGHIYVFMSNSCFGYKS